MVRYSYVNGDFLEHEDASLSVDDRGTLFSDGVYEVALLKKNILLDWDEHCARLVNSLVGIKIQYDVKSDELRDIIMQLAEKNALESAIIYLQITRGAAPRLHQFPKDTKPSLVITLSELKHPSDEQYQNGVKAITADDLRWKRRDYKTISLLPNVLAKQEAVESGAEEAILIESDGYVTEGSATNLFIINAKSQLQTHPANERILGGITRAGVLKVAAQIGVEVLEEMFTKDELLNASEVFITSTTKHILPVSEVDGCMIGNGKAGDITKKLMDAYQEYLNKQLEK